VVALRLNIMAKQVLSNLPCFAMSVNSLALYLWSSKSLGSILIPLVVVKTRSGIC